jgi:hypothetical protein
VDGVVEGFKNGRTRNGLEGTYATRIWFSTEGIVTPSDNKTGDVKFFPLELHSCVAGSIGDTAHMTEVNQVAVAHIQGQSVKETRARSEIQRWGQFVSVRHLT